MTASSATIRRWNEEAKAAGANFALVACDGSPEGADEDPGCCFPVRIFAETPDDVHVRVNATIAEGARVQEIYDLRGDLDAQMRLKRAWFSPRGEEGSRGPLPPPPTREQILKSEMQGNDRRAVQREARRDRIRSAGTTAPEYRPRPKPKPKPVDHEAPQTALEAELEKGVGGLAGRLGRAVKDDGDD